MTDVERLERDVAESRARLDRTIDRIQDRMSASAVVDDLLGMVRMRDFGPVIGRAAEVVRRNPVPVVLAAVGVGWLVYRLASDSRRRELARAPTIEEESVPVLVTGRDRIYDPDASPRHPTQDLVESRREVSARA